MMKILLEAILLGCFSLMLGFGSAQDTLPLHFTDPVHNECTKLTTR